MLEEAQSDGSSIADVRILTQVSRDTFLDYFRPKEADTPRDDRENAERFGPTRLPIILRDSSSSAADREFQISKATSQSENAIMATRIALRVFGYTLRFWREENRRKKSGERTKKSGYSGFLYVGRECPLLELSFHSSHS